jgi:hypothetical protein
MPAQQGTLTTRLRVIPVGVVLLTVIVVAAVLPAAFQIRAANNELQHRRFPASDAARVLLASLVDQETANAAGAARHGPGPVDRAGAQRRTRPWTPADAGDDGRRRDRALGSGDHRADAPVARRLTRTRLRRDAHLPEVAGHEPGRATGGFVLSAPVSELVLLARPVAARDLGVARRAHHRGVPLPEAAVTRRLVGRWVEQP